MTEVVLLSGGIDSAVCLAMNPDAEVFTVDYGQPHATQEIAASIRLCAHYQVAQTIITTNIPSHPLAGDSSMLVPGRNLILLSLANAYAQSRGLDRIVIGANRDDYDGYPDCRPEFFAAASELMPVHAPLVHMTKAEVIDRARSLDVPLEITWSCYYPNDGQPCGECDACRLRERVLA